MDHLSESFLLDGGKLGDEKLDLELTDYNGRISLFTFRHYVGLKELERKE
jgi:hypothetical protein